MHPLPLPDLTLTEAQGLGSVSWCLAAGLCMGSALGVVGWADAQESHFLKMRFVSPLPICSSLIQFLY